MARGHNNTNLLNDNHFIFDDADNELQTKLEEKLSDTQRYPKSSDESIAKSEITSAEQATGQSKNAIDHDGRPVQEVPADNLAGDQPDNLTQILTQIEKTDITRLVAAIESLKQTENSASHEHQDNDVDRQTALINASEIERLSFHIESTNREIASLARELASQTQRVSQLENDTPEATRRNVHQKITLLANSIIERNSRIRSLGADYRKHIALAAKTRNTDPQKSQQLMQQCKVIKLQIKLEGQSLEKERALMSSHTRLHKALQAPQTAQTSSLLQLADRTNEIRSQNANLKSLVDKLNVEFSQLRKIVEGFKSDIGYKPSSSNLTSPSTPTSLEDKQRRAANDASIAAIRASAIRNSAKPANRPKPV